MLLIVFITWLVTLPDYCIAQTCIPITTGYSVSESRCASTGQVQITAGGGSGNYLYRVLGPVVTNFSTSSLITGLAAGRYLVVIKDINTNCLYQNDSITIPGNYQAPAFLMNKTDVTCINGNDGTITAYNQQFGRAPFVYRIVAPSASNIGIQNATGFFTNLLYGNYSIRLTDSCGGIQTRSMSIANYDWWINTYSVSRICDSAVVAINLKDSKGNTTPNSIFNLFTYAVVRSSGDTVWNNSASFTFLLGNKRSVKLLAKDKCGNIKTVVWTETNKPSVNANVTISNQACSTFTATVTGQVNLTNPQFCLYNAVNTLINCNSTGVFNGVPYGAYCIKITDACYDTTISRCFTVNRPIPSVNANINISNRTCKDFTASVTVTTNLNNPLFCIYDNNNVLMYCNTTGVFPNLIYGSYCIKITNDPACYDTTITRCFTVTRPVPSVNANVNIINMACSTFTVILQDTSNWTNPLFCLYDVNHVLIICNTTGIFTNLPYGTYCISATNEPACYDTTIWRCFTVTRPQPSVGASVTISAKTCTSFTAEIKNQQNLNNAQYCLYNSLNILVACNTTGKFTNLLYGSYCIRITNNPVCYDTVITRCFSATAPALQVTLSASKSCTAYGATDITVSINSGVPAYSISVMNAAGQVVASTTTSSSSYKVFGLPALPAPQQYSVVVIDLCGNTDTLFITPDISVLTKKIVLIKKCPSGINPNGSADINVTCTTNMGTVTPRIIKKNNAALIINYNSNTGNLFSFYELPPASYIVEYSTTGCTVKAYDTVLVNPYLYPDLSQSRAYHCDSNTISVGAAATGGIAPYMYEIFQSIPDSPVIVTPPQANPVFTFYTITNYTLIRLRVIDGCGNASINDVSMQPLAPVAITPSDTFTCFFDSLRLSVDTIANATYQWYHKTGPNDSVLVSTTYWYFIPGITPADTGWYVCHVSVNNYCLNRAAYYYLRNMCGIVLPVRLNLRGNATSIGNQLFWNTSNEINIKEYYIERSTIPNTGYVTVGRRQYTGHGTSNIYTHTDDHCLAGDNYYRLKIIASDGTVSYSNTVHIYNASNRIFLFPNPVRQQLTVDLRAAEKGDYAVTIFSPDGKIMHRSVIYTLQRRLLTIERKESMPDGIYLVTVANLITGVQVHMKALFQ